MLITFCAEQKDSSPLSLPHWRLRAQSQAAAEWVFWDDGLSVPRCSLRRKAIIGHQFVNADWNKFAPTNAVNKYQYGLTQCPNARDARTNAPAMSLR
jgi:hypothetical protein